MSHLLPQIRLASLFRAKRNKLAAQFPPDPQAVSSRPRLGGGGGGGCGG